MLRTCLSSLLVLALALPAVAEDAPDKKASDAAFVAAVAAWPAPSAESAFRFEGQVLMNDAPFGTFLVEVGPAVVDGKVIGWAVHERLTMDFQGRQAQGDARYRFTADLRPLGGEATENFGGGKDQIWTVKDGKIAVTHAPKEGEAKTWSAEAKTYMLPGKAGLFMVARFAALAKAQWTGTSFSGTSSKGPVSGFSLVVNPTATHEGAQVLSVSGQRFDEHIEILLDPKTRNVLRMRMTKTDDEMVLTIVPKAAAAPADDIFARDARTAEEGAAQALLAVTVKDKAGIVKAFRWSSMYAHARKQLEAAGTEDIPSEAAWTKDTLETMANKDPAATLPGAEEIKKGLAEAFPHVRIKDSPEGYKIVIFPKEFAPVYVVMEKKEDGWKAIGMRKYA